MSHSFTDNHSFVICELSTDPTWIWATECSERPLLTTSFRLLLRGPRIAGRGYDFRTLQCRLSPFDKTYIADSLPARIDLCQRAGTETTDRCVQVNIPLDASRIAVIERMRQAGDVRLRFDFELLFEEVVELAQISEHGQQVPVWGLKEHFRSQAQVTLEVNRSVWLDRILPQTGYGKVHLIELPAIPIARVASCAKAFQALQAAQEHHKHGFYNAAALNCRQALDSLLTAKREVGEGKDKKVISVLDERWKIRLGESTYNWLNDALGALKRPGNELAHGERSNFDQFESQMLQAITTALIAYAARSPNVET